MMDLYGKLPVQVNNLLGIMRLRVSMKRIRILKMDYTNEDLVVAFNSDTPVIPERLIGWAQESSDEVRLLPGDRLSYKVGNVDSETRIGLAGELMRKLETVASSVPQTPSKSGDRSRAGNDTPRSAQTG